MLYNPAKLIPCLENTPYISDKGGDQLPETPVLSILQFNFHSDVDVLQPSRPVSTLWNNSLEYVSTIPGFQGLYWAPLNHSSSALQVLVLVQWDSGIAWRRFQRSIGFSMLLGYIAECYNRCVQLCLPIGISESSIVLESVSYQFPPALSPAGMRTSQVKEYNQKFKEKWESAVLPLVSMSATESTLLAAHGDWLERDDLSENQQFIGLLYWKAGTEVVGPQQFRQSDTNGLSNNLRELSQDAIMIASCLTKQLNYVSSESNRREDTAPDVTSLSSIKHSILKSTVVRAYAVKQPTAKDNPRGESPRRRLYGPTGQWSAMGLINQHSMPKQPNFKSSDTMDLITFRVKGASSYVLRAFRDLRLKLWGTGCSELRWGVDHENVGWFTRHTLLIEFRDHSLDEEIKNRIPDIIKEFSHQCGEMIDGLEHATTCAVYRLDFLQNLEIITFHVPADENDRRSFAYAYSNYLHTPWPQTMDGTSLTAVPAAQPKKQGWVSNQSSQSQPDTMEFSSLFTWKDEAARHEWYSNYSKRAREDFNGLGHIIDWLRVLCKRVDTQFLVLEPEDREIAESKLKTILANPVDLSNPKPVFTLW